MFAQNLFCKSKHLYKSKHLWWKLFLIKFHILSILLWTPLDECVWKWGYDTLSTELWNKFFEMHLVDIKTTFRLQKHRCLLIESYKSYLGSKRQTTILLVVSRLYLHFGFLRPFLLPAWRGAYEFVLPCLPNVTF